MAARLDAGGPLPADRVIPLYDPQSLVPLQQFVGEFEITVTDHGPTACGLPAESTATWVLRVGERAFCSRSDTASQVQFPACDPDSGPKYLCVDGGLSLTEAAIGQLPGGLTKEWFQWKFYDPAVAEELSGVPNFAPVMLGPGPSHCPPEPGQTFVTPCDSPFRSCDLAECVEGAVEATMTDPGSMDPDRGSRWRFAATFGQAPSRFILDLLTFSRPHARSGL